MGKKSLLAPTSGEKAGSKKSSEKEKKPLTATGSAKKAAPKSAKKKAAVAPAKKKAADSKTAKKKAAPKTVSLKKKAPSAKAVPAKSSAKPKAKKTAAPGKKPAAKMKSPVEKKPAAGKKTAPVSIGELLKRKYEMPVSGKKYSPPSDGRPAGEISSPPYFVGETEAETQRVRRLLFKKFDLAQVDAGAGAKPPVQEPTKPEKVAVSQTRQGEDDGREAIAFSTTQADAFREEKKPMDPTQKMAAIGIAVLALLLVMVLWASASNVGKFYVLPVDGQLEIWKGRFSPKGMDKIYTLPNASMTVDPKAVYSKEEAYGLIFEGIIADADALLGTDEMPDFERIRRALTSAKPFAVSNEMSQRLQKRLDKIDMMALAYKADILAGKGTVEDLTSARKSLEKAMGLNLDEAEKGLIQQKINWIDQKLAEAAL